MTLLHYYYYCQGRRPADDSDRKNHKLFFRVFFCFDLFSPPAALSIWGSRLANHGAIAPACVPEPSQIWKAPPRAADLQIDRAVIDSRLLQGWGLGSGETVLVGNFKGGLGQ